MQELIEDEEITEIMINGAGDIFYEKQGGLYRWDKSFESQEKLEDVIQQIVAGCNRVVNEASPIVDARLKNGARVNVVLSPIALNGPIVTIRRFPDKPITMEGLIQKNSLPLQVAEFLKKLVTAKYNIFISGGTGSGKTVRGKNTGKNSKGYGSYHSGSNYCICRPFIYIHYKDSASCSSS